MSHSGSGQQTATRPHLPRVSDVGISASHSSAAGSSASCHPTGTAQLKAGTTDPHNGSSRSPGDSGSGHQTATHPRSSHVSEEGISASHSGAAGSSASRHPTGTAQPNTSTTNSMTSSSQPLIRSKLGVAINLSSHGKYDQPRGHIIANDQGLAILDSLKLTDFIDLDSPDLSITPGSFARSGRVQAEPVTKPPSEANVMKAACFHKQLHDFIMDDDSHQIKTGLRYHHLHRNPVDMLSLIQYVTPCGKKSEPFYTVIHHPGTSAQGQPWAGVEDMTGFPFMDEGAFVHCITDPIDESGATTMVNQGFAPISFMTSSVIDGNIQAWNNLHSQEHLSSPDIIMLGDIGISFAGPSYNTKTPAPGCPFVQSVMILTHHPNTEIPLHLDHLRLHLENPETKKIADLAAAYITVPDENNDSKMDAVYLVTAALPLPHDHGIPAGIIILPVYNSSELAESIASLTNTPTLSWSWIQNEIIDVWLNAGMQHPTSMITKIIACTSLAANITLDSESESLDPWLMTVCQVAEMDEPTQNQWIAPFLVMLHMMMVEHLGSRAANSDAMTCKYGQFIQDAFDYMVTDPNPFGVSMINTAKEMFMMFEPATQAWRSQLPFFMFSIPAMFRLPHISSYLSDDQLIQIASRGENVPPPNPPGLQSPQS